MKKLLTSIFLLFISSQLAVAELDKNYLVQIDKMVAENQYEKALDAFRYYFKESRKESSLGAVRLSFCLSAWVSLGKIYPPAMSELILMSNERRNLLLAGKGNSETFQEYNAINRYIEKDNETLATFIAIEKDFPQQAASYHFFAKDLIINAKQYDLAKKYIDPIYEFENLRFLRESELSSSRKSKYAFANSQSDVVFEKNVSELIELANKIGMKDAADDIKRRYANYISLSPLKK
ncbi:hypothetical protein GCM10011613_16180 [Cellvibrio zantedeschiae]|uniref:Outer membrane lipoprotein BamD-like domain-containing protein n=1 Tax=Cellvibrio zantedeschiae TaxID=1237077 RepID=A0ABQ3B0A3_9GAMM|nr:hypothetical protein [Cellvibrio zantedeschiae]GGY72016.1 hypothetical protein GCM10011613_16180 [Cellvibrio zantedeschiae]